MNTTMPRPSLPRWVIKGVTDDCTTCDCCNRQNLKRTVAMIPLDEDGNEDGDAVYYGTACAAAAMRRTTTFVTNAASAARRQSLERDEWARGIISKYGPYEFATTREMAAAWYSCNPEYTGRGAREEVEHFLSMARAQLTDTTLGPVRPHTVADFRPYVVVTDRDASRVYMACAVPVEGAEEFHQSVRRDPRWRERYIVTVYALDEEAAKDVARLRYWLTQYRDERAAYAF
ncbi:hypothetical protein [Streptomyces sp. NPDC051561]|uniref:hypothetical protein n=1 Tax=Streptomyces sp. NPDC051561 TaxID=3365658 RepID=UPI0037B1B611